MPFHDELQLVAVAIKELFHAACSCLQSMWSACNTVAINSNVITFYCYQDAGCVYVKLINSALLQGGT